MKKTMMFLGLVALSTAAGAQTQVKPGFNLFSPQQDVEIRQQPAAQAERPRSPSGRPPRPPCRTKPPR